MDDSIRPLKNHQPQTKQGEISPTRLIKTVSELFIVSNSGYSSLISAFDQHIAQHFTPEEVSKIINSNLFFRSYKTSYCNLFAPFDIGPAVAVLSCQTYQHYLDEVAKDLVSGKLSLQPMNDPTNIASLRQKLQSLTDSDIECSCKFAQNLRKHPTIWSDADLYIDLVDNMKEFYNLAEDTVTSSDKKFIFVHGRAILEYEDEADLETAISIMQNFLGSIDHLDKKYDAIFKDTVSQMIKWLLAQRQISRIRDISNKYYQMTHGRSELIEWINKEISIFRKDFIIDSERKRILIAQNQKDNILKLLNEALGAVEGPAYINLDGHHPAMDYHFIMDDEKNIEVIEVHTFCNDFEEDTKRALVDTFIDEKKPSKYFVQLFNS